MNCKIGILTFHKSINYGSVLQAYALQNLLLKEGYKVEIIDYEPKNYANMYIPFKKPTTIWNILHNLNRVPVGKIIKEQNEKFKKFRDTYINLSREYNFESNYSDIFSQFDCVICGSDQVWNITLDDCDDIFFLPCVKHIKKIAYAVSVNDAKFNSCIRDIDLKKCISEFNYISCREKSGATKISNFIAKEDVAVTIDPTLLHSVREYDGICSKRIINQNYIFLYDMWSNSDALYAAKVISALFNLPVYTLFTKRNVKSMIKISKYGVKVITKNMSPTDFLSYIKYADFVITDSFHGTAFSLIFEKQFVCINEKQNSGKFKNDERITNILSELNINERYLRVDNIHSVKDLDNINYDIVTEKRKKLAKKSIDWLLKAIEE